MTHKLNLALNVVRIIPLKQHLLASYAILSAACLSSSGGAYAQTSVYHKLKLGPTANYGASPWYTEDIKANGYNMQLALDTGTINWWITTDLCETQACLAHERMGTTNPTIDWQGDPENPITIDFGPWGSLGAAVAKGDFTVNSQGTSISIPGQKFFGAIYYDDDKFRYLNWGGGIAFPSETQVAAQQDIDTYFSAVVSALNLSASQYFFSMYTDPKARKGALSIGADIDAAYDDSTEVRLEPRKSTTAGLDYLWGTNLVQTTVGTTVLPELSDQIFYLDSGSSRFKGGGDYVWPILDELLTYQDSDGNPIFKKYNGQVTDDNGNIVVAPVGIRFADETKGPSDYSNLPNLTLRLGQSCGGVEGQVLKLELSPDQYSYLIDEGDYSGTWVVAIHQLDGVDGLLVGSTLLDLVYSKYTYVKVDDYYSQDNMYLYQKDSAIGGQPDSYQCVAKGKSGNK